MNKWRLIITSTISIVLVAILLIGSTYSVFTTEEIDEESNVYTTGNLSITYKVSSNTIQFTDNTPMTVEEADGVKPYRITVTNNGNVPYKFDVILNDTTSSTDNTIDYQYIMTKVGYLTPKSLSECTDNIIKEDVILLAGESVDIDVRVWLDSTLPNSEMGKSFYAKLSIDGLAVYNDSEIIDNSDLSLRYMNTSSTSDFKSDTYKTYIKNASFVDYIDTSSAISTEAIWDVSEKGDNSIVAWLEPNTTEGYYDLYIGSNEKIYAKTLRSFFADMTSLENISFDNLDTSLTTIMGGGATWTYGGIFFNCSSLISLDLSDFDTSNVTTMGRMFSGCTSLTNLDLSSFDTSNVTLMGNMFYGCSSLTSIDLSNWNTGKVTTMSGMFYECSSLTSLDLSHFDTGNVTNMTNMFRSCENLASLDASTFDTNKTTNMSYMFYRCSSLTSLNVSSFDTGNVTDMQSMFQDCSSLISLDVSKLDTSKVTNMRQMFRNCSSLISLNVSSFDTSNVTLMGRMFSNCSSLTSLNLSNFDTSKVTDMSYMFNGATKLKTELTIRNTSTSYTSMFNNAATSSGSSITVNYIGDNTTTTDVNESTESLVESMIDTKSDTSNVVKGSLVE